MTLLALLLYVGFAGVAFGWRTWLQWRRTGDTGLRLHAAPGTVQWWAKLGFVVAVAAGLAAPVAGLLGLDPVAPLDHGPVRVAGVALALAGIAATTAAQVQMGASWRIGVDRDERTALVTDGVFGLVRNPIFSAMLVTAVGLTLMVGNVVSLVGLAALVAALEVQVRSVEEPYLLAVHAERYARYAARVGRFVPGLGRLRASARPSAATPGPGPAASSP
ncbi:MAG: isoprenylcysteine carboxylmethyltransferase family protein [Acidimicrobiia bacterium]